MYLEVEADTRNQDRSKNRSLINRTDQDSAAPFFSLDTIIASIQSNRKLLEKQTRLLECVRSIERARNLTDASNIYRIIKSLCRSLTITCPTLQDISPLHRQKYIANLFWNSYDNLDGSGKIINYSTRSGEILISLTQASQIIGGEVAELTESYLWEALRRHSNPVSFGSKTIRGKPGTPPLWCRLFVKR